MKSVAVHVVADLLLLVMMMTVASFVVSFQNHLPSWQLKEDAEFVSTRNFDFHKFAENYSPRSSTQRWSNDSNELPEDFVLSKSPDPLSHAVNSDSENEDEIFLVFRGKPNSRVSSFDECQATAGKIVKIVNIVNKLHSDCSPCLSKKVKVKFDIKCSKISTYSVGRIEN